MARVYSRFHHEFHTNYKIITLLIRKYTEVDRLLKEATIPHPHSPK